MGKKLLAYRNYAGIGDWIMALTVLKMVNIQYPDIEIHLNCLAPNLHEHKEWRKLPTITQEIIRASDVRIDKLVYQKNVNSDKDFKGEYDYVSGHMRYSKSADKNFIESMVDRFNKNTGLKLEYMSDVYMQCSDSLNNLHKSLEVFHSYYKPKNPYILMQSCTKRKYKEPKWKDYGYENMREIASKLQNELQCEIDVIQIGTGDNTRLPTKAAYIDETLFLLHNLIINSLGFIGMDGMLGVYAAHHDVKQYIIYSGLFNMNWTKFPNRIQINGNEKNNNEIVNIISEDLCVVPSEKL